MKRLMFLCYVLFILICGISFSEEQHPVIRVGKISYGIEVDQLGYEPEKIIPGAGFPCPIEFELSNDNHIYIYDWAKRRIAKYDSKLIYIGELRNEKEFGHMYSMKIDKLGNIYLERGNGIFKYKNNSNLLYFISDKQLSKTVFSRKNYFPHDGYLFYYNDDFSLAVLDQDGKKLAAEKTDALLTEMNKQQRLSDSKKTSLVTYDIIDGFNKEHKPHFFKGKQLYINNKEKYLKYVSFVQEKLKTDKKYTVDTARNILKKKDIIMFEFLGYDNTDNAYWQSSNSVLVLSLAGEIVANVGYNPEECLNPKIAPNGDIYLWKVAKDGVTFYKIARNW